MAIVIVEIKNVMMTTTANNNIDKVDAGAIYLKNAACTLALLACIAIYSIIMLSVTGTTTRNVCAV